MGVRLQLDDELITRMYEDGKSCSKIAAELGVSYGTINRRVKKALGSCRSLSEAQKNREPASEETRKRMSDAKIGHTVSEDTRQKISDSWKTRKPASEETIEKIREKATGRTHTDEVKKKISDAHKAKNYSEERVGENNPNWRGGLIHRNGYLMAHKPEHPNCTAEGLVPEHRLVMESMIGRYLTSDERVHHIDGNKANNIEENLMLFPSNSAHSIHHWNLKKELLSEENVSDKEAYDAASSSAS